jgi:hypothetical protein
MLLWLATMLLPVAAADPVRFNGSGGLQGVTWDFSTPAGYVTQNVSLDAGNATLATTADWWNYTTDADFLASEASAANLVVNSGLRLVNRATSLIQDGTFNQTAGPWTYTNGTTGQVLSARDPGGSARLWQLTPRTQFDSMDAVFGTPPWTSVQNGKSFSVLSQSTVVRAEGTGSLRDDLTIGQVGGGFNWVGAIRDDSPGTWNWSAYNRLGVWINPNASGLAASILVGNVNGQNWYSWIPQSLSPGWHRYIFDISPSFGTNDQIKNVEVGFLGNLGKYTAYVDDLVLSNYTAFDEAASVSQTFTKPDPTSGSPGTLTLRMDVTAAPSVSVVPYLRVNVGGFSWSESPVPAGTGTMSLDLSGDPALRGTGSFNLTVSLELIRIGAAEASMSVWIDNVTLTAEQYASGTFTSLPSDAGSPALWAAAALQATTNPPATSVAVEMRTGNTSSPGDPSWSSWQTVSGSRIESPPNRFLQWRLGLNTDGAATPVITGLSIRAETYAPTGVVRTASFLPGEPLFAWQSLDVNDNRPPGTSIAYAVSVDGGANWTGVASGQNLAGLATKPVMVRATLSTGNTSRSPSVTSLTVWYRPSMWSELISPWTVLVALGVAIAGYVGWKRFPWRTAPDDLFLVGLDGRLLMHTAARPSGEMDDDILAGMLTAITMFVRDAFKEEHEELKGFEFGNRNVAVERGQHVYLAAIYPGELPVDASRSLNDFLTDLGERYGEMLAYWYFVDDLPGLREMLTQFAGRGRYRRGDWRRPWRMLRRPKGVRTEGGIPDDPPKDAPAAPGGEGSRAEAPLVSVRRP